VTRGCHRRIETASVVFDFVWKDYGAVVCLRALFGNTNSASMFVWYSYPFTRSEGEAGSLPQKMAGLLHGPASASYPSWSFSQRGHVRVFLTSSSLSFPPKSHNPTSLYCFQSITFSLLLAERHVYISSPGQEQTSQHHQVHPSSKKIRVLAKKPSPSPSSAITCQDSSSGKVSYNNPMKGVGFTFIIQFYGSFGSNSVYW
jgi:hypothetical protein